jgi:hypothetical protein
MAETLSTTHDTSPESPSAVPLAEQLDDEKYKEITDRLHDVRSRVAELTNEEEPRLDDTLEMPVTEEVPAPIDDAERDAPTAPEAAARSPEKAEQRDPRSRLRKIGDFALKKIEDWGQSTPAAKLEEWGWIPLRGSRHKQHGWNFSAMVARRYVKAQARRKERIAGFLSEEANDQLTGESPASPEKPAEKEPTITEELRDAAHAEAEEAKARKAERKEDLPAHERSEELRRRLHQLRSELGAQALATADH